MRKKTKGFTLIELLITVSIISVLVGAGVFSYHLSRQKSRDAVRLLDMKQLVIALEAYYDDHGFQYPNCDTCDNQATWESCLKAKLSPYLAKLPEDPKGDIPYCYKRLAVPRADGASVFLNFALESKNSDYDDAKPISSSPPDTYYHYELKVY